MISKISQVPSFGTHSTKPPCFVNAHDSLSKEDSESFVANTECNIEFVFNLMILYNYN